MTQKQLLIMTCYIHRSYYFPVSSGKMVHHAVSLLGELHCFVNTLALITIFMFPQPSSFQIFLLQIALLIHEFIVQVGAKSLVINSQQRQQIYKKKTQKPI